MNAMPDDSRNPRPPQRPAVSIWVPLLLGIGYWASLFLGPSREAPCTARIRRGHDEDTVAEARRASRAIVCLTSRWSANAKISERALEAAADRLARNHAHLGIR